MILVRRDIDRAAARMLVYAVVWSLAEVSLLEFLGWLLYYIGTPVMLLGFMIAAAWWDDRVLRGWYVGAWVCSLVFQLAFPHMLTPLTPQHMFWPGFEVVLIWAVVPAIVLYALCVWAVLAFLRMCREYSPAWSCPQCDYDLTGNVSGVCPECGTPIPKANA